MIDNSSGNCLGTGRVILRNDPTEVDHKMDRTSELTNFATSIEHVTKDLEDLTLRFVLLDECRPIFLFKR